MYRVNTISVSITKIIALSSSKDIMGWHSCSQLDHNAITVYHNVSHFYLLYNKIHKNIKRLTNRPIKAKD